MNVRKAVMQTLCFQISIEPNSSWICVAKRSALNLFFNKMGAFIDFINGVIVVIVWGSMAEIMRRMAVLRN